MLDLLLQRSALVVRDCDAVRLTSRLVGGKDVQDTVYVDVIDRDLRNTARGAGNAGELELIEEVVVLGARTLTLLDLDKRTRLVNRVGQEDLGLLRRYGCAVLDERHHDIASCERGRGAKSRKRRSRVFSGVSPVRGGWQPRQQHRRRGWSPC